VAAGEPCRPSGRRLERDRHAAAAAAGRGGAALLLTFDGEHELYWSATLRPTRPRGDPLEPALPPGRGTVFVNMDSDGSVLAARSQDPGGETWWDCNLTSTECTQFARSDIQSGDPGFIGNDM
jgi:hypothetical protein